MKREVMKTDDGDEPIDEAVLSPRAEAFCQHYGNPESPEYSNGTKSAAAAGYSTPHVAQYRLRRNPKIIKRLEQFQDAARASAAKILTDLEHTRLRALEKGDLATAAACSIAAGKHLGMFYEKSLISLDMAERPEYDERLAVECSRLARLAIEDAGAAGLGAAPALEGKVGPAGRGALPEPKPAQERNE